MKNAIKATGRKGSRKDSGTQEREYKGLEAFANLGESPESWQVFRSAYPHFFPESPSGLNHPGFQSVSDWLYWSANEWASLELDLKERLVPCLLFYRDR